MLGPSLDPDAAALDPLPLDEAPAAEEIAPKFEVARTKRLGFGGVLAIVWLVFITLFAIIVPLTMSTTPGAALSNMGFLRELSHPFGGDRNGNDLTVLLAEGVRNSMVLAIGAIALGLAVGGSLGLLSGYFRGRIDSVVTGAFNILLAVPALILASSLVAVLTNRRDGAGNAIPASFTQRMLTLMLALGIVSAPVLGRITRANTLAWSQREFVMAARAQGAGHFRIMVREVLPNVMPAMFSIALLGIAITIVAEGGLSILGAGIQGGWSLGRVLATGKDDLAQQPPHRVRADRVHLLHGAVAQLPRRHRPGPLRRT